MLAMMCKDEARVKLDFARHLEAVFLLGGEAGVLSRFTAVERKSYREGLAVYQRPTPVRVVRRSASQGFGRSHGTLIRTAIGHGAFVHLQKNIYMLTYGSFCQTNPIWLTGSAHHRMMGWMAPFHSIDRGWCYSAATRSRERVPKSLAFTVSRSHWKTRYSIGMRKMPMLLAAIMPEKTGVPTSRLVALQDDALGFFQPLQDEGCGRGLGLVIRADHINVIALLVRQHGRARDRDRRDRLNAFQDHSHELAVEEFAERPVDGAGHWKRRVCNGPRVY